MHNKLDQATLHVQPSTKQRLISRIPAFTLYEAVQEDQSILFLDLQGTGIAVLQEPRALVTDKITTFRLQQLLLLTQYEVHRITIVPGPEHRQHIVDNIISKLCTNSTTLIGIGCPQ